MFFFAATDRNMQDAFCTHTTNAPRERVPTTYIIRSFEHTLTLYYYLCSTCVDDRRSPREEDNGTAARTSTEEESNAVHVRFFFTRRTRRADRQTGTSIYLFSFFRFFVAPTAHHGLFIYMMTPTPPHRMLTYRKTIALPATE